jgi:amino acid adenylation domain-containing protein
MTAARNALGKPLHGFFAEGALRYPDRTALEVAGAELSYRRLAGCARNVAARLLAAPERRPRRAGLLASRSPAAYVGYLGALLAGAAVVPLNPSQPLSRTLAIARAAHIDALIFDDAGLAGAAALADTGARCIDLSGDGWEADTADASVGDGLPDRSGDGLAYIMFTSGSTGTPKGVPIRHRNITPFIEHHVTRYETGPECRWTQNGELTFDASVTAMFVAWGCGGTFVVPRNRELLAPARFLNDRGITHCVLVPSVVSFAGRMGALPAGSLPDLRCTVFGGEQLTLSQARAWRAAAPESRIENAYGPTELTVCCSAYWLPEDESRWPRTSNGAVPIGAVYPYLESLILAEDGRPAEEGELCVRGVQRFDGYLDSSDDIGKFVSVTGEGSSLHDGTAPLMEGHWYRTGDRVRREDGQLVCLGRIDHQLKLGGHRIEPGEVEAVLSRHPAVADVLVLPLTAADGDVDLVAAYTGAQVGSEELAELVRSALPAYMLPRRYRWVSRFPLTENGKVDRRALADLLAEAG